MPEQVSQTSRPSGWRGGRQATQRPTRYRWQGDWSTQVQRQTGRRSMRRRLCLTALLGLCIGLSLVWAIAVTYRPRLSPMLAVFAPAYEPPLAPFGWSAEDADRLERLHGQTFALTDDSDAWSSVDRGVQSFGRQLRRLSTSRPKDRCLIIYLAMHGAVDRNGRACLLTPDASPIREETWLPVEEILRRIADTPGLHERPKLLVIDAVRQTADWNVGSLCSTFPQRLSEEVEKANVPRLAVIASCGPNEQSWTSQELGGSIFAHYFQLASAGAADLASEGGDADRRVSLLELSQYLQRRVSRWASANRGVAQRPQLYPASAENMIVTWSLGRRALERLSAPLSNRDSVVVPEDNLNALWRLRDTLAGEEFLRFNPELWQQQQRRLVWLEQAAHSGRAYRTAATQVARETLENFERVDQRLNGGQSRDVFTLASAYLGTAAPTEFVKARSMAAAAAWGGATDATEQERSAVIRYLEAPTESMLQQAAKEAPSPSTFVEAHWLKLLARHHVPTLWRQNFAARSQQIRVLAEQLAAAKHEQAWVWARPAIDQADTARRRAEDWLFMGEKSQRVTEGQVADADAHADQWRDAQQKYDRAQKISEQAASGLALRNRVWSELPWMVRCFADPGASTGKAAANDEWMNDTLLRLVERAHSLSEAIDQNPASEDPPQTPPFFDLLKQFESDFADAKQQLLSRANELQSETQANGATLREMEVLLQCPLIDAATRQALRRRRADMAQRLQEAHGVAGSEEEIPPSDYLERCVSTWRQHPALALLPSQLVEDADPQDADPQDAGQAAEDARSLAAVEEMGAVFRNRLRALPSQVISLCDLSQTNEDASGNSSHNIKAPRQRLTLAERLVRSAGAFASPVKSVGAVRSRRRYDLQQLFLWRAERAMDDFLGGGDAGPPFFASAASDELANVETVGDSTFGAQSRIDQVTAKLRERRDAANKAASVVARDVLVVDDASKPDVKVAVDATPRVDRLPPGQWAVFLRDGGGRIPNASAGIDMPLPASADSRQEVDFTLDGADLLGRGADVQAVTLFRGHEFASQLALRVPGGALTDLSPRQFSQSTIVVEGLAARKGSVVFVLDCSNSMSEEEEFESAEDADGAPQRATRLDLAKNVLNRLMESMAEEGQWRVGVRLFGHRVGFNRNKPNELESLYQEDYGRSIPPDLLPSNDEELVLPLGRFDFTAAQKVSDLLLTVKPWGETPLYLSIDRALRDFDGEEPAAEKLVVAITDGANKQTNPRSSDARSASDVLSSWRQRQAKVFIIGFGVENGQGAEAEFRRLSSATGGEYIAAENAQELLEAVRQLLKPDDFIVLNARQDEVAQQRIGQSVTVTPAAAPLQPYTVEIDSLSENVVLEGGEGVRLVVDPVRGELVSASYDRGAPQFFPLVDQSGTSRYQLGLHRPITTNEGVQWTASVRRSDKRFVTRPAEMWLEVSPRSQTLPDWPHAYYFYDVDFLPDTATPACRWTATNWPEGYDQAAVRCWVRFDATPPAHEIPLEQWADRLPEEGAGHRLPDLPGVEFQVRTTQGREPTDPTIVAVIERHSLTEVGSVKIEMSPTPNRITRQFDAKNKVALHTFEFLPDASSSSQQLLITPFASIHSNALHLEQAVQMPVSPGGDLIELRPARAVGN